MIVWSLLTWACSTASVTNVEAIFPSTAEIINGVVTAVLFLFAGWLADVYVGRYKVMKVSIWFMWLGSVCGTLLVTIHLLSPHNVLKYISGVVAYACVTIESTGLIVNAVPFGTDRTLYH